MTIQSYRDLKVWQKSMELVVEIYSLSKLFPRDEQFGLTNQIRRASVSIAANIAEGHGRLHRGDFMRHLSISRGSLAELETHLQIAIRLDYLNESNTRHAWSLLQDVGRLLNGLISSLDTDNRYHGGNGKVSELQEHYQVDHMDPHP